MIGKILKRARKFDYESCEKCPWSQKESAYGESCNDPKGLHYANWKKGEEIRIFQFMQDPGGTTPQKTSRLCMVHNSLNKTDKTARHLFDLWQAAVSGMWLDDELEDIVEKYTDPFIKKMYSTNAAFHSRPITKGDKNSKKLQKKELPQAVECCAPILLEQIKEAKPDIIIPMGKHAVKSLIISKILKDELESDMELWFKESPFIVKIAEKEVKIFCVPHTGARTVRVNAKKFYMDNMESIEEKIITFSCKHPIKKAVKAFRRKYDLKKDTGKGLSFHLALWLKIGEAIRALK